jgi:DNA-binding SARP family transcriptional activator
MSPQTVRSAARPGRAGGLVIRVLGPLEVLVDGAPIVVDTRKALAIVAVLAAEGRPFARDELAALLWPDADDESARGALRRTLSVLRAALGDRWLRIDRSQVALDLATAWIDLRVIEAATLASGTAGLQAAADQARGPFLAGFTLRDSAPFDDWRATRAVSVERSVLALLDRVVTEAEAKGDDVAALSAAARRVDLDPLDEAAHRRLMALLAATGDRAGAIRQYRACVAILDRELGVPPLAETTELYEAIRDARGDARAARPAGVAVASGPAPVVVATAAPAPLPMVGR